MCKNKHIKARKYRRKQLASGKIVISRRKSLISIVYLSLRRFLTVGIPVTSLFISVMVVAYRVGCVRITGVRRNANS